MAWEVEENPGATLKKKRRNQSLATATATRWLVVVDDAVELLNGVEQLIAAFAGLRAGLDELASAKGLGEVQPLLAGHDDLRALVDLVADEEERRVVARNVAVDAEPVVHALEALAVAHVVDDDRDGDVAEVVGRERGKPLSSGSVPALEVRRLPVFVEGLGFEVRGNCRVPPFREFVVEHAQGKASFAGEGLTDERGPDSFHLLVCSGWLESGYFTQF